MAKAGVINRKKTKNSKTENTNSSIPVFTHFSMSDRDFSAFRQMIYDYAGIEIKPHKKTLLVNRLSKRLRNLGLSGFGEYLEFLKTSDRRNQELIELIDCVTTNKTDFFREPQHFTYLQEKVIPELLQKNSFRTNGLRIWSAACSTGEEPYTLAICLSEYLKDKNFEILASDVSETVLRHAVTGIYDESRVAPIPMPLMRKYFLRGNKRYKIKTELAKFITFKRVNLNQDFHHFINNFDVIFCRNVMIYFDKPTQQEIINKFFHALRPQGYLFLGHSETLQGMNAPFTYVAPSVYRK